MIETSWTFYIILFTSVMFTYDLSKSFACFWGCSGRKNMRFLIRGRGSLYF